MHKIATTNPDVLAYDCSPRKDSAVVCLFVGAVIEIFSLYSEPGAFAIVATVGAIPLSIGTVILFTRITVEFNRSVRIATVRRRYIIRFPVEIYDLAKFEGVNIRNRMTVPYSIELQSRTVSVRLGSEFTVKEAENIATEITQFTGMKPISQIRLLDRRFHLLTLNAVTIVAGALIGIAFSISKQAEGAVALFFYPAIYLLICCASVVETMVRRRALFVEPRSEQRKSEKSDS